MGTSFNYVIFPHHRRKDGTIAVKIRMTHNGKSKYCSTDISVTRDQLTRKQDRITDRRLLDAIEARLKDFRDAAAAVEGSEWYTADQLWDAVNERLRYHHGFRLDFFEFGKTVMEKKERGTAALYEAALGSFSAFLGTSSLDVNEIAFPMLLSFREHLERRNGKNCRSASLYLSCLRHVFNQACDAFNDPDTGLVRIPRQPFRKGLVPPQPEAAHRALTVGQIVSIRDCDPVTSRGLMARDAFLLSFYTIGTNTADLYSLKKADLRDGVIEYRRAKTDSKRADHAMMRVRVEPEAAEILERWQGVKGLLPYCDRYADFRNFNKAVNTGLKEIAGLVGIDKVTSYHARHSWATIATNSCGIDFDTVHQALNHARRGADRMTGVYVERDFSRLWEANRKVLDLLLKFPDWCDRQKK